MSPASDPYPLGFTVDEAGRIHDLRRRGGLVPEVTAPPGWGFEEPRDRHSWRIATRPYHPDVPRTAVIEVRGATKGQVVAIAEEIDAGIHQETMT